MSVISNFLHLLLPPDTAICITTLRHKSAYNKAFAPGAYDQAAAYAAFRASDPGTDVYFGCAGYHFTNPFKRTQANVAAVKCLWADLDVGPAKDYKTKVAALQDVKKLCAATGLPAPLIVDSGHGLHVYYILSEAVDCKTWLALATRFFQVCTAVGLKPDPARARDAASILRLPGTYNRKDAGNPLPVKVLSAATKILTPEHLAECLLKVPVNLPPAPPAPMPAAIPAPAGVSDLFGKSFEVPHDTAPRDWKPMYLGCRQIREMATSGYQAWFLASRTCMHTTGGEKLVRALSMQDKQQYSAPACDKLLASLKSRPEVGPALCSSFQACEPAKCRGCPYAGKISTPWKLCTIEAPQEVTIAAPDLQRLGQTDPGVSALSATETITLKPFDDGLFKVVPGVGCCVSEPDENDVPKNRLILPAEIYIYGVVVDSTVTPATRTYLMRKIVKGRAPEDIMFDLKDAYGGQKTELWLAQNGLAPHPRDRKAVLTMMNSYLAVVQNSIPQIYVRDKFGWVKQTDAQTGKVSDGFIVGDRLYSADKVTQVKLSERARGLAPRLQQKGSLEAWKAVPRLYRTLDQKTGQLLICMGFGAPLMRLGGGTAQNAVVNLFDPVGGKGKTSLLKACASIWGQPNDLLMSRYDTNVSRFQMLSCYSALPAFIDELTGSTEDQTAALLYDLTAGREKARSTQSGTGLTKVGHWSTVTYLSANQSFYEQLRSYKSQTMATQLRLIEIRCDFKNYAGCAEQLQINDAMNAAHRNYGLAGPVFIQYILKHPELLVMVEKKAREFSEKYAEDSSERFWLMGLAIPLYAGVIAKSLGLIDYDMQALKLWVINTLLPSMRAQVRQDKPTASNTLTDFLNDNLQATLTVRAATRGLFLRMDGALPNTAVLPGQQDAYAVTLPTRQLTIRHELDTGNYYIAKTALVDWCKARHLSLDELSRQWRLASGSTLYLTRKVLASGVQSLPQASQQVYQLYLPSEDS